MLMVKAMSAPVRVAVAVSNSNTSSDQPRFGKNLKFWHKHSLKLWQKQSLKETISLAGEIASSKALSITCAGQSSAGARQGCGGGVKLKYEF